MKVFQNQAEMNRGKSLYGSEEKKMNPGHVDEDKWEKAKKACVKEYGKIKWPIVTHIYEQMGGTFG